MALRPSDLVQVIAPLVLLDVGPAPEHCNTTFRYDACGGRFGSSIRQPDIVLPEGAVMVVLGELVSGLYSMAHGGLSFNVWEHHVRLIRTSGDYEDG